MSKWTAKNVEIMLSEWDRWDADENAPDALRAYAAMLRERESAEPVAWRALSAFTHEWRYADQRLYVDRHSANWEPLYTHPPQPQVSVPDGWKLVPIEPTGEMLKAGATSCQTKLLRGCYDALLAAAPPAPKPPAMPAAWRQAFEAIAGLSSATRQGGAAPEDLEELDAALNEAICIASAALDSDPSAPAADCDANRMVIMTDIADKLADALREAMYMNWVEGNSLGNHAPEYFKNECLELLRYHEAKKKQIDIGRRSRLITLTVREIKDLAEFAGLVLASTFPPDDDQLETEISITTEPAECTDDDGKVERYAHLASVAEYPEEGCMPLGEPLPPNA